MLQLVNSLALLRASLGHTLCRAALAAAAAADMLLPLCRLLTVPSSNTHVLTILPIILRWSETGVSHSGKNIC